MGLRPHVADLRHRGWPVEVEVNVTERFRTDFVAEDEVVVVTVSLNVDDTRVPIESIPVQIDRETRHP